MRNAWAILLLPLLLTGCGGPLSSPVFVQSSLVRMDLPERPSRVVRLSGAFSGPSTFVVLTPDQVKQAPSATATTVTSTAPDNAKGNDEMDEGVRGRLDFTFGKRLTLGTSAPRYGGPTMFRAKLFLAGPEREKARQGDVSLALTGAYGRDHRDTGGTPYTTRVSRTEQDFGLVLGWRTGRHSLVYLGPYYQKSHFAFDHTRPSTPDSHGEGDIAARGGHVGVALFAGRFSSFLLEFSRARVDAPGDRATLDTLAVAYQLDF